MIYTQTKEERIESMYDECVNKWVSPTVQNIVIYSLFSLGGTLIWYDEEVKNFLSLKNSNV